SWCHENGLQFIGHIVEDNQAHMHHGYGPGHFFRTTRHFDTGGYDFVLRQVDSEQKQNPYEEHYPQFKHYRQQPYPDFFHFTLAKLAQSAAHLEVQSDIVMCENFGAYGWDLGLREMKWLTDWQTARGTNWYVPHAFSPLFPDADCPPHFFAGGKNPQWPFFRQWADYANRSCMLLRESEHISRIAVMYPAESHWSGDAVLLDEVTKSLMQHQIDFHILSFDLLQDEERCLIRSGLLEIGDESFQAVILPGIETIPLGALIRLHEFSLSGGEVIAIDVMPKFDCSGHHHEIIKIVESLKERSITTTISGLPACLERDGIRSIVTKQHFPDLRFGHFRKGELDIFFLNNENKLEVFEDFITFNTQGIPEFWEPMGGYISEAPVYDIQEGKTIIPLRLKPFQSVFIVFSRSDSNLQTFTVPSEFNPFDIARDSNGSLAVNVYDENQSREVTDWVAASFHSPLEESMQGLLLQNLSGLGDWNAFQGWDKFSGTVAYEASITVSTLDKHKYVLNLGEVGEIAVVYLNGMRLDPLLCPPYLIELPKVHLKQVNLIKVEVTNTLGAFIREGGCNRDQPAAAGLMGPVLLECYVQTRI
ncbi:MAG TPA: glycosyl hydrolase, partial [Bacilli bacterium]